MQLMSCDNSVFKFVVSVESHNQWGRPGGPQGAAVGNSGEEAEGDGNSMISQTVAMAIAGTSAASPMSRPSSFLLNSQVTAATGRWHTWQSDCFCIY